MFFISRNPSHSMDFPRGANRAIPPLFPQPLFSVVSLQQLPYPPKILVGFKFLNLFYPLFFQSNISKYFLRLLGLYQGCPWGVPLCSLPWPPWEKGHGRAGFPGYDGDEHVGPVSPGGREPSVGRMVVCVKVFQPFNCC